MHHVAKQKLMRVFENSAHYCREFYIHPANWLCSSILSSLRSRFGSLSLSRARALSLSPTHTHKLTHSLFRTHTCTLPSCSLIPFFRAWKDLADCVRQLDTPRGLCVMHFLFHRRWLVRHLLYTLRRGRTHRPQRCHLLRELHFHCWNRAFQCCRCCTARRVHQVPKLRKR
jgi:hypothetical protein